MMILQKDGHHDDDCEYIRKLETEVGILRSFFDNSEMGIYVSDFQTCEVLYANNKAITLFDNIDGKSNKMIGRKCWELLNTGGAGRCPFCPHSKLASESGEPPEHYTWEHHIADYGLWIRIISQVITWPDGRLVQMNTFYDITEIKRMQEVITADARKSAYWRSQQELQMILDAMPVAVCILNFDDGALSYANKSMLAQFGCNSVDDFSGKTRLSLMPEVQPDGRITDKILAKLIRQGNFCDVFQCFKLTGEPFDARITSCTIDYQNKKSCVAVLEDITAQQESQRRLLDSAEQEREANKLKSNFLSNMSHEIRTPMNAIIGLTEIEIRKEHSKGSLDVFRKINISAKSLLQIVNDILDMSKIEADKLEIFPDEFELESVLNSALLVVTPRIEGKRVELITDVSRSLPRAVVGDKTRLWQVLKNYLDNAAKYTQEGRIILYVSEDTVKSDSNTIYITFEIRDEGIGMTPEQLEKAIQPFGQVYNELQKSYTGTGLGMPLSKRICEIMGGTVEIRSALNQGTSVKTTLPFGRVQSSEPLFESINASRISNLRVLAVDDDEISLLIIKSLLDECGAECTTVSSGEEALEIINNAVSEGDRFDIILLDYLMSGINGIETAKQINENKLHTSKIMMVTAYESQIIREELELTGILDIIEKPFVPTAFYEKVMAAAGYEKASDDSESSKFKGFKDTRVLVCEDNEINQIVVAGMLEEFGVSSVLASDGKEGIELLDQGEQVDLILMDVHMPVMGGYEATRILRSNPKYDGIPIISLTADAMADALDECLACGMNDYLAKPFIMDDFHQILFRWLPVSKRKK